MSVWSGHPLSFRQALRRHLELPSERTRYDAYELGRQAVEEGVGVLGAIEEVAAAIVAEVRDLRWGDDPAVTVAAAAELLGDYLAPFELLLSATRQSLRRLEVTNARLEDQTRALEEANRDLAAAKHEAEEAAQARAAFLAGMSHEMRTPLNAIIGLTSVLVDSELDSPQRENVDIIRSSGEHLLSVIDQILDLARVDAGRVELEQVPVDVARVALDALEIVAPTAHARGLELLLVMAPEAATTVVGDAARIRQVLLNLLSNAVKFTPAGEVELGVIGERTGDRVALRFSVRDTGVGIDADRLDGVFEPFSQAEASTTRRFGGSGLGLAISRGLVELMGGRMSAVSAPGEGSTFSFEIDGEVAERDEPRSAPSPIAGRRLLAVDDHLVNLRQLAGLADRWGATLVAAASGAEALAAARSADPFDAILVDHSLPDVDATELAGVLAGLPSARGVPLVLLSTALRQPPPSLFAAAISKPVRPETLHDTLAGLLGDGGAGAARSAPSAPAIDARLAERHPLSILVADDSAVNRRVAQAILSRMGYEPDLAVDGQEALEKVLAGNYDLVLLDVHMPRLDGVDAARRIVAELAAGHRPRLVALTADVTEEQRRECEAAGMDDYLPKPVTVEALAAAIERCHPHGPSTHH